jgi:hypothetical protein
MTRLRCEKYNQDVDIDFRWLGSGNLCSEHSEPGTRLRVREAPAALLLEGRPGTREAGVPLIDSKPCPHPLDYCIYRSRCVINRMCMDDPECRKKRRANGEDTR